jgi:deoxyribonuclease-1
MSWVTNALQCGTRQQCRERSQIFNRIEADLHNLYPSRTDLNSARSSHRFGLIRGEKRDFGSCDFEIDRRARVAEPAAEVRGTIARAMFYMASQYRDQGLIIFSRSARLLQDWHNDHPPSIQEQQRNRRIAAIQGNSNPFIDEPELVNQFMAAGKFD